MIIIDGSQKILGRLATHAAKLALKGEQVAIVNCAKVAVSGRVQATIGDFIRKNELGTTLRGPFIIKSPAGLVRRAVRGMLPYPAARGREAFARVKCYDGLPAELSGKPVYELPASVSVSKLRQANMITMGQICARLAGERK